MPKRPFIALLVCSLATVASMGCASMFLNGGKLADHDYAKGRTDGYKVVKCTLLSNNSAINSPNTTYFLVDGGLFERSPDGSGTLIQNRWQEADGDHYFAWVQSSGWEYVIPKSGAPTRIVYTGLATGPGPQGTTKPTSSPSARCEMAALGASS